MAWGTIVTLALKNMVQSPVGEVYIVTLRVWNGGDTIFLYHLGGTIGVGVF